jgi:hypothetical protein
MRLYQFVICFATPARLFLAAVWQLCINVVKAPLGTSPVPLRKRAHAARFDRILAASRLESTPRFR